MMLGALRGWRAQAANPKQTPNPFLRKILVEQADEALRRVEEMMNALDKKKGSE